MTIPKLKSLMSRESSNDLTPPDGSPSAARIAETLRARRPLRDAVFDRLLPRDLRLASSQHWSPIEVATRASAWLDSLGVEDLVDIGSGPGKFCVVAALSGRARYVGIEQRERLVLTARNLARTLGVEDRVTFIQGTFGKIPPPEASAYYLYNPFGENLYERSEYLDDHVELTFERYYRDVAHVKRLLYNVRVGTYVMTYNGFGGRVPACFDEVFIDREMPNVLRIWKKVRFAAPGSLLAD